jgi:hypothetical protein
MPSHSPHYRLVLLFLLCGAPACSGGRFLGLLGSLSSWAARSSALTALAASYTTTNSTTNSSRSSKLQGARGASGASVAVRGQLASSRLLDVLEAWLSQARREAQITFARQLLQVGRGQRLG